MTLVLGWKICAINLPFRHGRNRLRAGGSNQCRPVYLALLWFIVFPISVAYGIVKKELFDIRNVMRSSAAYGAATLAITGLYAALVAAADAALIKLHMDARSPQFTVAFLFFAIVILGGRARVERHRDAPRAAREELRHLRRQSGRAAEGARDARRASSRGDGGEGGVRRAVRRRTVNAG